MVLLDIDYKLKMYTMNPKVTGKTTKQTGNKQNK